MKDPQTAYFFRKFYGNVIKWWFVAYNTDAVKIWPSKAEEEAARLKEEEEEKERLLQEKEEKEGLLLENTPNNETTDVADDAYNATTGSYSGLYGQGPMDDDTQSMLDQIMHQSSSQTNIDFLLGNASNTPDASSVQLPPEQDEIIKEANLIYERLLREAKEDEERKAAEIEAVKRAAEAGIYT
ncbi:MAG: hypothetical protein IJN64_04500 [Lachnospiraceae bacterium]|nr:hypothetical protein [Lachnospiraceae bacterium]